MIRIISQYSVFKTLVIVFMFLVLSNHGCNSLCGKETGESLIKAPSEPAIHVIFTGEENGYLEPCGCSELQLGGLPKRQTLINNLMGKNKNWILLSLGDLPGKVGRQDEIKMETTLNALDQMGYAVHNIGEKDINMGIGLLGYLSHISSVDFISSNIVNLNPQILKIKPYVVKEIKIKETTLKVGILGIVSPELIDDAYQEIEVVDPIVSLKPLIIKLSDKTDLLLLLSHAEIEDSIKIAEIYPEFDLIISGHGIDEPGLHLTKVKNTYVIPVGEKGKYLGTVTLSPKFTHTDVSKRSNSYLSSAETIPLDERFEDSPETAMLLRIYQQRLKEEELLAQVFKTDPPSNLTFIGNDDCAVCHNKIFKHWEETRHASAYETLVKAEHEYDPECIECHVIGLNYFTGFETIESTPKLKGVGCESCHGPGSAHKETQSKDYGKADVETCEICHESEHSPNFQFKEYWQKIKHPLEKK
ncbi:MAG: multiheme c-type cytochrome [Thermodesulfobacteriota bacterium]